MAVKRIPWFLFFWLALLVSPETALAADQEVEFRVPVKLSNIHPYAKKLSVQCRLEGAPGGFGRTDFPLNGSEYDGIVKVNVDVDESVLSLITGYSCQFYLFPSSGSGEIPRYDANGTWYKAKTNTPLVTKVQGQIPKSGVLQPKPTFRPVVPKGGGFKPKIP